MRRILTFVAVGMLGFAPPAFAQNATPVLIDQGAPTVSGPVGQDGQDALAQVPDQQQGFFGPGGPSPLLIAGGLALGLTGIIIYAVSQDDDDPAPAAAPASP